MSLRPVRVRAKSMVGGVHLRPLRFLGDEFAIETDFYFVRLGRGDAIARHFAVAPLDVHRHAAAGAEPGDAAGRPDFGQCRQQIDLAGLGLEQHFANSGGVAEIAVDLKRRMGIEQIRVHAAAVVHVHARIADQSQQIADQLVGPIAIVQPGPEIDFPGRAPTGAHVAAGI